MMFMPGVSKVHRSRDRPAITKEQRTQLLRALTAEMNKYVVWEREPAAPTTTDGLPDTDLVDLSTAIEVH
ncbi:uncharacterized protein LDX57_002547 [Aspergillus melleus]|uniref:uncharacterized protein n=1 Tax=Aspergillus melleus TaxID=138277 RepID=UPI001E8DFFF5|nr:uncharacterized protein LDX57_002547 [Aspergillus melleus]KAH8424804.1 hypothetical protein LDX57_002547 [Aspergillus melleus]